MSRKLITLMVSLILLVSSFGLAQRGRAQTPARTQPDQGEVVRVGTSAVQIEAIVTDKNGRRIAGLTGADFQVMDEGATQTLDYFAAIEGSRLRSGETATGGAPAGSAKSDSAAFVSSLARPYRGRHLVMVFDDLNLTSNNFLRSRLALSQYINNKLAPEDMMAIVSTSGSLGSLQQFTNDKQRLLSALNRIAFQIPLLEKVRSPRYNMTPSEAVRIDSGDQQTLEGVKMRVRSEELAQPDNILGNERQRGQTTAVPDGQTDALENSVRTKAKAMVSELNQASRNNLKMLESIFRGMAELPGRKIVLYLSESLLTLGGTTEDLSNQILQLIEVARRSGVSVYALDAAGLSTNSISASERVTGAGTLIRLATPGMTMSDYERMGGARVIVSGTGGDLIANTNDLVGGLDRAIEDSNSYYVLGFKPGSLDNKFHRLTVTVKNRSDLIVRTRRGYLAVNQETAGGTNTELAAALISPITRIDVPLEVVANVVPKGNEQIVMTGLHVGRNYLTLPAPGAADQTVAYEVLAWVFAAGRDQPVGVIKRTLTLDLLKDPQAREKLKTEGFVYVPQPLTYPPGIYQIRAVIREKATGAVGSAFQFFEVPNIADKKVVSLSSLVLTISGRDGFSGMYSFKRGTDVDVRYVIYNLPSQTSGLAQRIKLLDAGGHTLMDSELPLAAATTPQAAAQATRINVPPARGRYALIVSLRDAKGKVDIERRADLVVE